MAAAPPNTYYAILEKDASFVDLDATGNMIVTGTGAFTGAITATGGVVGDVTGDVTGDITGDITGDVTGDVTGNLVGGVQHPVIAVTADGAIAVPAVSTSYYCTKAGVAAMTLVDPTATTHDGVRLTFIATTANANTLDLVTGINGGAADIGTFGGAAGDGTVIEAYQGVWYEVPGANTNVTWA